MRPQIFTMDSVMALSRFRLSPHSAKFHDTLRAGIIVYVRGLLLRHS